MQKLNICGILILTLALCVVFSSPQNAYADTFVTCEIVRVGIQSDTGNSNRIRLTHIPDSGAAIFTDQLFLLSPDTPNEMLATALTALSLDKSIFVAIDDDGVTLNRLYVDQ